MKFHCERCKTKYSISDDRVRGKILKIRCKNCSSVITVREPKVAAPAVPAAAKRAASAPAAARAAKPAAARAAKPAASTQASSAGQAALAGAFKKAVNNPSSSAANMQAAASPVSLEADWYLSKDGKQEGPFSMEEAHSWVSQKAPEDDLYCWSEGFDDWLPVEKVSHFRGIRVDSFSDLGAPEEQTMIDGAFPPKPVETPKPLFAATMEAVAKNEAVHVDDELRMPSSVAPPAKPAAQAPPIPGLRAKSASPAVAASPVVAASTSPMFPTAEAKSPVSAPAATAQAASTDLAIGEASRVVDLAALMANRGNAPAITPSGSPLPGTTRPLGNGTGMGPALNGASVGLPGMSATPQLAPLGGLGSKRKKRSSLLLTLIGASVVIALGAGVLVYMMSGDDQSDRIARGSVGGSESIGYSITDTRVTPNEGAIKNPGETLEGQEVDPKKEPTKVRRPNVRPKDNPKTSVRKPNNGEVDLTGDSKVVATGPLDPDEFFEVVKKGEYSRKMCYERSLKKDPLLKVPKSIVNMRIKNGAVTSVKISNIGTTPLGACLTKYIKRWKFRKSTTQFNGQFPLYFGR